MSVIKDDGTVASLTTSNNPAETVSWLGDTHLAAETGGYPYLFTLSSLPKTVSGYVSAETPSSDFWHHFSLTEYANTYNYVLTGTNGTYGNETVGEYLGSYCDAGFALVDENFENYQNGSSVHVTSNYNTGWMNGDIKLATLSDTDDTDVTGSELVTNGTFDSDVSGWSISTGSASSVSGRMELVNGQATQSFTTVVGETYVLTLTATNITQNGHIRIGTAVASYAYGDFPNYTGDLVVTFKATTAGTYITLYTYSLSGTVAYDNISVRLAEEDRSVNGKGLQVFGTVTKNPVATGADLVAYSGWSGSNYLRQPYNSDLAVGTGDICTVFWYNAISLSGSTRWLIDQGGTGFEFALATTTFFYNIAGGQVQYTFDSTNTWNCVALVRRNGVLYAYMNGELVGTASATGSVTATGGTFFGIRSNLDAGRVPNAKLALFRASATAPSPEQIAKIYEDEKVLFQENAQATLYGSSDAVTALAYDDTTELLHVGTSAGRSVFQGLRRVDNTTDAVGAAISASNGLVAED